MQSSGRDFGSIDDTDYVILHQTKRRARELMIQWIFEAIDEDTTLPPITTSPGPPGPAA